MGNAIFIGQPRRLVLVEDSTSQNIRSVSLNVKSSRFFIRMMMMGMIIQIKYGISKLLNLVRIFFTYCSYESFSILTKNKYPEIRKKQGTLTFAIISENSTLRESARTLPVLHALCIITTPTIRGKRRKDMIFEFVSNIDDLLLERVPVIFFQPISTSTGKALSL